MMPKPQRGKPATRPGTDAFHRVPIAAVAKQANSKPSIRWSWLPALLLIWASGAGAAELIPNAPDRYFNDYAKVISPATAERLERQLTDFEKETSNQILVALFPKMQSDSSLEDYTVRVARAWRAGQKAHNNGAILFIFVQNRKMRIEVGYGLEGALPDAIAKRIIEDQIKPHFQQNDYDGGVVAGVTAMIQATRGEYRGAGTTVAQGKGGSSIPL